MFHHSNCDPNWDMGFFSLQPAPSCVVIIELIDLLYYINNKLFMYSYIIYIYYLIKLNNFWQHCKYSTCEHPGTSGQLWFEQQSSIWAFLLASQGRTHGSHTFPSRNLEACHWELCPQLLWPSCPHYSQWDANEREIGCGFHSVWSAWLNEGMSSSDS